MHDIVHAAGICDRAYQCLWFRLRQRYQQVR